MIRQPMGPDPLVVSEATADDVDAVRALLLTAYRPWIAVIGREPAPMTADVESLVGSERVVLARRGDAVVGMIVAEISGDAVEIDDVAVAPAEQGSGLGGRLLAVAEERGRSSGARVARLFTNEAMTANLGFYARRGYVETERRTVDGFRRVFFEKELTPEGR